MWLLCLALDKDILYTYTCTKIYMITMPNIGLGYSVHKCYNTW